MTSLQLAEEFWVQEKLGMQELLIPWQLAFSFLGLATGHDYFNT
jgi:hypothetical protein